MYDPSAFLISAAALTSIFSFFFGGYFRERESAYRLWIRIIAYQAQVPSERELKDLCSELESKERIFRQAKGLLWMILLVLISDFGVFQFYSFKYFNPASPFYQPYAYHTYFWFTIIIGIIVIINCLEFLYIRIALDWVKNFPYFKLRRRVTGQDRLSMIWQVLECSKLKLPEYSKNRIPERFYHDQEYLKKSLDD